MPTLPSRPNLDHLKKQAKDLLRACRAGDPAAFARLRLSLPAARGRDDAALAKGDWRLHDAQSCLAREYGFPSWDALRAYVEHGRADDPSHRLHRWLDFVYQHDNERPRPGVAARMLADTRNDADATILGATKLLREHGDRITPQEKTDIETVLAQLKDTRAYAPDHTTIREAMEMLDRVAKPLSEAAMSGVARTLVAGKTLEEADKALEERLKQQREETEDDA